MRSFGLEWACRMDFYGCKAVNKLTLMLSSFSVVYMVKMGRKPREGILCKLPCLILRVRAMSKAQPKGTNSLCSRCTMVCDRMGLALWLWQPHK